MNLLIINIIGLAVIALIVYWFWIYKPKNVQAKDTIRIIVEDGVYQPSHISVPAATEVTLEFERKDETPCAEMVIFPELDISENLPINKTKTIKLKKLEKGSYQFHCQMQMYKGELHAE